MPTEIFSTEMIWSTTFFSPKEIESPKHWNNWSRISKRTEKVLTKRPSQGRRSTHRSKAELPNTTKLYRQLMSALDCWVNCLTPHWSRSRESKPNCRDLTNNSKTTTLSPLSWRPWLLWRLNRTSLTKELSNR
jgi:hypothetical protein